MDFNQFMLTAWNVLEAIAIVLGGATMMFRGLLTLSKYTKTLKDDKFVNKVLKGLQWLSGNVSNAKGKIEVHIK